MSDRMTPIPFDRLMEWALSESGDSNGGVFGLYRPYRYAARTDMPELFGQPLEACFGPAAGPHTQLAQNLITAYAAGGRFFELKTVQILDGEALGVKKPCISAANECYNCEWSTELTVPQAFDEYVKAWFAIKLLAREMEWGDPDGFIFNMSVGYDLDGIRSPKLEAYIEGMKNAGDTPVWRACRNWALANTGRFAKANTGYIESLKPHISSSVTLSTLHGCPPGDIERIAAYLISEKGLNVFVKCNPTILGYERARKLLDGMGYGGVAFGKHHFEHDLQMKDAIPMFGRLRELAVMHGLTFGLKLTNTLPVDVAGGILPADEMYMSGGALFPLTLSVACDMAGTLCGKIPLSFSGGADIRNTKALLEAGVWPVTMAATLLKPGGYAGLSNIAELTSGVSPAPLPDADALKRLLEECMNDVSYKKPDRHSRKQDKKVPLLNCGVTPCHDACPLGQDIPSYLRLVAQGRHLDALKVITGHNPLPFITGTICPHRCMDGCTRQFYESPVPIRAAKLEAAYGGYEALLAELSARPKTAGNSKKRVAVVGGGPAGLAAAFFLARAGIPVTVFEKRDIAGGLPSHIIPDFRIAPDVVEKDVALIRAMGAEIRTGAEISFLAEFYGEGFTDIILACGASLPGQLTLEYGQSLNALKFLEAFKKGPERLKLGCNVAVVGGGNTAVDTARAAKRVPGVENVTIVYRRTRQFMPAEADELALALSEGVTLSELLVPVGVRDGVLTCSVMILGAPDVSGRRAPRSTGKTAEIPATTVIAAVGEQVDGSFCLLNGIACDTRGVALVDEDTLHTVSGGAYVIGDALRGPSTVAEAIADAAKAASAIIGEPISHDSRKPGDLSRILKRRGFRDYTDAGIEHACSQCLECGTVCELCVEVCPNRANVAVRVDGMEKRQVVHLDALCNECGNCAAFCPYDSSPYKDKFTLFWSEPDFNSSKNDGFLPLADGLLKVRLSGEISFCRMDELPQGLAELAETMERDYKYLFQLNV